ncbi:MAG: S8 family serine peptidase, partial [Nocardioides sp.]|nr:S8 family serine peptidase [Nocardioides sp.]
MKIRIRGAVGIAAAVTLAGGALAATPFVEGASAAPGTQASMVAALGFDKDVTKSRSGSYVVLLKADPLLGTFKRDQLDTAAARSAQQDIIDQHNEILSDAGVPQSTVTQDLSVAENAFALSVSHADAVKLAADPKVAAVVPDELVQATADGTTEPLTPKSSGDKTHRRSHTQLPPGGKSGHKPTKPKPPYHPGTASKVPTEEDFLGLTGKGEAYDEGIDGSGVLVGVVDTGIWPEHPSFADDGSYPEAPDLGPNSCQFGNSAANPDDAAFTCNNKLVGARDETATYRSQVGADPDEFQSARDDEGHGTHTASTTAGDSNVKAYIGGRFI